MEQKEEKREQGEEEEEEEQGEEQEEKEEEKEHVWYQVFPSSNDCRNCLTSCQRQHISTNRDPTLYFSYIEFQLVSKAKS